MIMIGVSTMKTLHYYYSNWKVETSLFHKLLHFNDIAQQKKTHKVSFLLATYIQKIGLL